MSFSAVLRHRVNAGLAANNPPLFTRQHGYSDDDVAKVIADLDSMTQGEVSKKYGIPCNSFWDELRRRKKRKPEASQTLKVRLGIIYPTRLDPKTV